MQGQRSRDNSTSPDNPDIPKNKSSTSADNSSQPSDEEINQIPLPDFSGDIAGLLKTEQLWAEIDRIVEQTAFWILSHGDMKKKEEYDDFGRRMIDKYPRLSVSSDTRPYAFFLKKLSRKLRNVRNNAKKRSESIRSLPSGEPGKKKKKLSPADSAAAGLIISEDAQYQKDLKQLKSTATSEKPDIAKIKVLMGRTYKLRRLWLGERAETGAKEVLDRFPVLTESRYVSFSSKLPYN